MKKSLVVLVALAGAGLSAGRALRALRAHRADADLWRDATDTV